MDGELGKFVRGQITAKVGLVPMERIWDLGFRQITNSIKPIKSAADLAGMKLRVPGAPALVSLFKALGTHPVSMQFGEVYTSLQTKVVDGQENPMSIIDAGKFYEVQKFCSLTNHVWDGHWITFNRAAWDRLPDDVKTVVARAFNEGALAQRAELAAAEQDAAGRPGEEGHELQHGRDAELPRAVEQGRLLQGMAREARRRSLVAAGEPGRQARVSAARPRMP